MDTTTEVYSFLIILFTLVVTAFTTSFARRRRFPYTLRRIAAFDHMPSFVGRAIEADRPLHVSLGSAGLGGDTTLLAIASAELAFQLSQRAAIGDTSPILTLSDASAFPLAQDELRRAYDSRGLGGRFRASSARWYPQGSRSLAFAAAISVMMRDDDISSNIFAGSYGPELALMMDASKRYKLPAIAVSNQLEGQAVAFAMSDYPLIGEEIFSAAAYLQGTPTQTAQSVTIDVLRWGLVIAMLIGFVAALINNGG
jgi:hypothetical protein